MSPSLRSTDLADLAPLADRLALLQLTRLAMAVVAMVTALTMPDRLDVSIVVLDALCCGYALATTAVEVRRRRRRERALRAVHWMLLADGLFVAVVTSLAGGPRGVLGFLAYLHVVAVTLLVSYRTGLKIAVWHVLLLFVSTYVRAAGAGTVDDAAPLHAVAIVLVAAATAAFSGLNERELRRAKVESAALADLAGKLQETRRLGEIRTLLVEQVLGALPFERAAVVLGDDSDAVVKEAWTRREPQLVRTLDPTANPRLVTELPGAANLVVLPLIADGEPVGVLVLEHGRRRGAHIPGRTVAVATQFAAHAALALRNAVLLAEVEKLATTDALTGLANRRVLEDTLHRTVALSRRTAEPAALIVVDVDRFKSINDTHGHQVGDDVLRLLGEVLAAGVRETDLVARFGGEEFVVVLPATDAAGAAVVAERIRAGAEAAEGPVAFTISAGVAAIPDHGEDEHSLLAAADQALYRSKRRGRNRVTVAPRPRVATAS